MLATAQDKEMARLMGIRVSTMIAITFAYSSILGAVAGILVGPIFFVTKDMGFMIGLKAFCSAIVGGFGSVPGAILGDGVIEVFAAITCPLGIRRLRLHHPIFVLLLVQGSSAKIAEKA
jgi:branched-chain amino acid transport system permease protein